MGFMRIKVHVSQYTDISVNAVSNHLYIEAVNNIKGAS